MARHYVGDPGDASRAPCPTCGAKLLRVKAEPAEFWRCQGAEPHDWIAAFNTSAGSLFPGPAGLMLLARDPESGFAAKKKI